MTREEINKRIMQVCKNTWNDKICKEIEESLEPCEDYVSREEALYGLNSINGTSELDKAFEVIENLPSVTTTQRWIPVSERLPEESLNSVIGWDAYRERCVFVQYIDGHFQITGSDESFDIVAWMPLPKPYKAEMESEE